MRKVAVNFFRADFSEQPTRTFEAFLQGVNHVRQATRLQSPSNESALYMPNVRHRSANLWAGELQYIRKTNLPDRIDLTTLVDEALGLLPSQGLVERCHFAYRTDLEALALQASRYVRTETFASYVSHVADTPLEMTLVVKQDAYQRLMRMRKIASLNVRIENPPDAAEFTGLNDPGVSAMADLLTNFGAAKIEITLKRENRGFRSLSVDGVRDFVDRVIRRPHLVRESVQTLSVKGKREDDDNLEVVDLIEDRISFEAEVGYDAHRRLDPAACENLMVQALDLHERDLRRRQP
jgi:hypothetical protein